MNLRIHGYHAAADWLLYKIRAAKGAIALHLEDDDTLTTRLASRCRATDSLVGVYGKDVRYSDMLDDLRTIRDNLPKRGRNGGRRAA